MRKTKVDSPSTHQHWDLGNIVWRRWPELRKETLDEVTRYIRKAPAHRISRSQMPRQGRTDQPLMSARSETCIKDQSPQRPAAGSRIPDLQSLER
jgi:hypothetical protein